MFFVRSKLPEMFKFEVPSLTVGTLDTLMTLSDDLVKTDSVVEMTVRKIERTTAELFGGKSADLTVGGRFCTIFLTCSQKEAVPNTVTHFFVDTRCSCAKIHSTVRLGFCKIPKSATIERTGNNDCRWSGGNRGGTQAAHHFVC